MNYNQWINSHFLWKFKLAAYIAQPDRRLDAEAIAADNRCALGEWIHGEGKKFAGTPEFARLVEEHARFHAAASEIVRQADAGQAVSDERALGANSEYAAASNAVVLSLMKLKSAA
jgi:hypothetical protein